MSYPETVEKIKLLMIERLKLKLTPEEIQEETPLFGPDSLDLDSIDVLELVVTLKKEFGCEIKDRETAEKIFTTVGAIARFVEEYK